MNPFSVLSRVQSAYLSYVHTLQRFANPAIRAITGGQRMHTRLDAVPQKRCAHVR